MQSWRALAGERLKAARQKRKLTQRKLAKELNVGRNTIQRYECGEGDPSTETLRKWAELCEVSADYLLGLRFGNAKCCSNSKKANGG
jgi:transcriptional regulator with XRE-family HTH domain